MASELRDRLPELRNLNGRKARRPAREPVRYSEELAEEILERVANGEGLKRICADPHMPDSKAVRKWAQNAALAFGPRYARAREERADNLADEIIEIADSVRNGASSEEVNAARLMVDSRKWIAAKLMPRRYGDKVTLEGNPDAPIATVTRIELVPVAPSLPVDLASLPLAGASKDEQK